jgi:hypothetical protein
MELYIYIHIRNTELYIYAEVLNRKQKPSQFSLIHSPFAHCANWKLVVCLFVDKEVNVSFAFANGRNVLNGLAHLWSSVSLTQGCH